MLRVMKPMPFFLPHLPSTKWICPPAQAPQPTTTSKSGHGTATAPKRNNRCSWPSKRFAYLGMIGILLEYFLLNLSWVGISWNAKDAIHVLDLHPKKTCSFVGTHSIGPLVNFAVVTPSPPVLVWFGPFDSKNFRHFGSRSNCLPG